MSRAHSRPSAATLALTLAMTIVPVCADAQDGVVNIYSWTDYIDPTVLDDFTRQTGIKVVYDTYDTNESLETRMKAGKAGYDVVVPSGPVLQRLAGQKVLARIDRAKLPNAGNLWPEISERLKALDPGNAYAVNYMWGTTGIGYNVQKLRERLGDKAVASWDVVLRPDSIAKLRDCGVTVLDAPDDIYPGVLRWLGMNPDSKTATDYLKATDALVRVRSSIRKFHSSEDISALANGDVCLFVGYSGDVLQARKRAEEAKNGVQIAYAIPKEGALMWFDSFAIPADAPNADNAYAFIDYMLRPDVAARNTNFVNYASGNLAAKPMVRPDILNNPGIYPRPEIMKRLFTTSSPDDKLQKVIARQWMRVKTGK